MITLRKVILDDATNITLWKQEPYMKHMALDEDFSVTLDNQKEDIHQCLLSIHATYEMILKDDIPIGYIRIDYLDKAHRYVWLRFALGSYRGHGYMKEALLIKLNLLNHQHVHRIECEVYDYNLPSIHLLESIGFVKEGIKRKAHYAQESYHDIYVYGLLLNEIDEG